MSRPCWCTATAASLNALIAQDREALRSAAAAVDRSGAARDPAQPLAGIPVALKDNIDTVALPTTGGTGALAGRIPARNARSPSGCSTPARSWPARPTCTSWPSASPTTTPSPGRRAIPTTRG
jgi:hypothetical protein